MSSGGPAEEAALDAEENQKVKGTEKEVAIDKRLEGSVTVWENTEKAGSFADVDKQVKDVDYNVVWGPVVRTARGCSEESVFLMNFEMFA